MLDRQINRLSLSSQKYGLGIRDPQKPVPDPGPGVKKASDPGSGSATLLFVVTNFTKNLSWIQGSKRLQFRNTHGITLSPSHRWAVLRIRITVMRIRILPLTSMLIQIKAQSFKKVLKYRRLIFHKFWQTDADPAYHFDADQDPDYNFDPDPTFLFEADL